MSHLLDTNACVEWLRGNRRVVSRAKEVGPFAVNLCSVVRGELVYGIYRHPDPAVERQRVETFCAAFASLPFDDPAAERYAEIRYELEVAGTRIGERDLMIASISLAHDLTLVTHNTREFGRVRGLRVEDWQA